MMLRFITDFILLHFLSRKTLLKRLKTHLEFDTFRFYPEYSGKSAIFKIAEALKSDSRPNVALLPEYICNIVPLAFEKAGYQVLSYSTNELLEPDLREVMEVLSSKPIKIFLTASIFGSSGFLDQLGNEKLYELIRSRDIFVIVDLCQDIRLVQYLPTMYGKNLAAVVSFNDKSFLGVMGGGILSQSEIVDPPHRCMKPGHYIFLYRWLIEKIWKFHCMPRINAMLKNAAEKKAQVEHEWDISSKSYEYGRCTCIPWSFELVKMEKIQMILGLIGIRNLHNFSRRKEELLDRLPDIKKTRFFSTSPYIMINKTDSNVLSLGHRRKPTYAIHGKPELTLRKDLLILHNKGFFDSL